MLTPWLAAAGGAYLAAGRATAGPCVRLGRLTAGVPNPDPATARGTVFLLRGQGAVFSPGFGLLCGALRAAGVWAEDLRCVGDAWAVRMIADRLRRGERAGPLAFVGHSRGGRRAMLAARRLGDIGVAVDLVVCLDVAFPPPVPVNVRRAVSVYRSRRRLYPARPLTGESAGTVVENVDLDATDSPLPGRWLPHVSFAARSDVRAWVMRQVIAACDSDVTSDRFDLPPGGAGF